MDHIFKVFPYMCMQIPERQIESQKPRKVKHKILPETCDRYCRDRRRRIEQQERMWRQHWWMKPQR